MNQIPIAKPCGPYLIGVGAAIACMLAMTMPAGAQTAPAEPTRGAVIQQDLRKFAQMGSVLFIAAHPDDENTQLITYLARGRNYRTAYLSLTRGDGGQNLLGPEFGDVLGVIRTQELLAARRLDGGEQFFTRAMDFGYSKTAAETLKIWDRQQVLSDVVRVMREFQPDVVIVRFNPDTGGTHGHHTASAILGRDAFKIAGDPKSFPEQLDQLSVWQPTRLLLNGGAGGRGGGGAAAPNAIQVDIGGNDPLTGESFASIAGRSRAMHKTQGFGNFAGGARGGRGGGAARPESFTLLGGEPATRDIMDGIDTTWNRVGSGGAEIGKLTDAALSAFDPANPAASVPALLTIRSHVTALPSSPLVTFKLQQLDRVIQSCLDLKVETTLPSAEIVPGEMMKLHHIASVSSDVVPVKWVAIRYPSIKKTVNEQIAMKPGESADRQSTQTLPASTPVSQPYWLRADPKAGLFTVSDPALIGRPENPPAFPVEEVFDVGGQTIVIADQPVQASGSPTDTVDARRRMDVVSPVTIHFTSEVSLFKPGQSNHVSVEAIAMRPDVDGSLSLQVPGGWKVEPTAAPFKLSAAGDRAKADFDITAPSETASVNVTAIASVGGATFDTDRMEVHYAHIPLLLLQPVARTKAVSVDMSIKGTRIGYVAGAGDSVAECIEQMGCKVTQLTGADLNPDRLKDFDSIVFGVRAFNVRRDLAEHMPALFAWVESGGNVIVQYNRPDSLPQNTQLAPYSLRLSGDRVTDENAAVTFLAPEHPALNSPNKITAADFDGWIQERGIYYPNQWDEHFVPILASGDPGEAPLKGGLLVAQHGKGYFVYSSLVWFRELPAGVPGAYRLFANLLSLGK